MGKKLTNHQQQQSRNIVFILDLKYKNYLKKVFYLTNYMVGRGEGGVNKWVKNKKIKKLKKLKNRKIEK